MRLPSLDKWSKASLHPTSCPDLSGALKDGKAGWGGSSGICTELPPGRTSSYGPVGASLGLLQQLTVSHCHIHHLWRNNLQQRVFSYLTLSLKAVRQVSSPHWEQPTCRGRAKGAPLGTTRHCSQGVSGGLVGRQQTL